MSAAAMCLARVGYNVGAFTAKKTLDFNWWFYGMPLRVAYRQTELPRKAAVDAVAELVAPLFAVTAEDIELDEVRTAPKAALPTEDVDSVNSGSEGRRVTNADVSISGSSASGDVPAAQTDQVSPSVFLPAPSQVVTFDKVAERAQLLQEMKDMWPSKCQDANEKLITSLKAKLGAAENKISDLGNTNKTLVSGLSEANALNASLTTQLTMLRDVLSSRTNITAEAQPTTTATAKMSSAPGVSPAEDSRSRPTSASAVKEVSSRSANQRWTNQENLAGRSASSSKNSSGGAWRPPRPSTSAVTPKVTAPAKAAPKAKKQPVRRAWSWADEADLSEEDQKRLLDQYLRDNPDPFNEGRR